MTRAMMVLCFLAAAGCQLVATPAPGRPVSEAYGGGHDLRVLDIDSPLRPEKRVPVLSTPEVFAAYVPSHVSGDLMIGDHWVFFKLRDAQWFVERLQDPDPPADGDAPPESLKPLRDLDWSKSIIPHKP
jgi:hypothetical protein